MNLDDFKQFASIDPEGMLNQIDHLPEQLAEGWKLGLSLDLPQMGEINSIVIAGMGGSAIGAELLAGMIATVCPVPVIVHRDYGLPAWAKGRGTLAILSSHSGNTEETLSAFDQAITAHCQIVVFTTGGKLLERAKQSGSPFWIFRHHGQPRAAVGYSFGLLLALLTRLGLIANIEEDVSTTINSMIEQRKTINAESPLSKNPAKRVAGQMMGRYVTLFGAGPMTAVARRWKSQINEVSKSLAAFEPLPEADHNTLAGICFPQQAIDKAMSFFIRCESDLPRNAMRLELTQQLMLSEGINTDSYLATGRSVLEQLWRAVQFGDYVAYYLAMANEIDPTAIPPIMDLKLAMSN
ncbi:MAG: bifunctional phosphoglucose/phosphomannose isomerase [Anaerolineaceae bacterium]